MPVKKRRLTQDRAVALLNYDQQTGVFTWRSYRNGKVKAGDIAGHIIPSGPAEGRHVIGIDREIWLESRLAWLYMTGDPAEGMEIVPKDGNWGNMAFINLMKVKDSPKNLTFDNRDNKFGVKGVYYNAHRNVYGVRKRRNGVIKSTTYHTLQEAKAAALDPTVGYPDATTDKR